MRRQCGMVLRSHLRFGDSLTTNKHHSRCFSKEFRFQKAMCTPTRPDASCHDAGVRSWYSRILSSGPAVNALRIPVFVFVCMCVCACMDICTCTPYRPCALISSCLSVCVFLCFCGYLHMRVTAYDLLTESAHRLHVRLHVKHMHSFRGSTHRLL